MCVHVPVHVRVCVCKHRSVLTTNPTCGKWIKERREEEGREGREREGGWREGGKAEGKEDEGGKEGGSHHHTQMCIHVLTDTYRGSTFSTSCVHSKYILSTPCGPAQSAFFCAPIF